MPLSDAWIDFVAGWCSGAVAVLCLQPVDTVLTRWQAGVLHPTTGTTATTTTTTGRGVLSTATRQFTQTAGLRALWRGASPMITAVPLQNALLMGGYGVGLAYNNGSGGSGDDDATTDYRRTAVFVGGCTGGVLQSFLMSPVELVKVSQQCAGRSLALATSQLWTSGAGGTRSDLLWRGLGATLLRDGVPHGVWFVAYEEGKTALSTRWDRPVDDPVVVPSGAGACAATAAWTVGYPADLIKTRIQASSSSSSLGIVATGRLLIREADGDVWRGLYRGFGLKLVRSVPASMIGFCVYEFVKRNVLEVL